MRLLDTNVLAKWGHPTQHEQVVPYLKAHAEAEFVTSTLVTFEFFRPAKRRDDSRAVRSWLGQVLDGIEPFTESASLQAASLEATLQTQQRSLRMRDLLIGAHAKDLGATFVTADKGDFDTQPVQNLLDVDVITT